MRTLLYVRKKPSQKRAEETCQMIKSATNRLMDRMNFCELTTDKIALEAGVSIGSLYQFFERKEGIAIDIIEDIKEEQTKMFNDGKIEIGKILEHRKRERKLFGAIASMNGVKPYPEFVNRLAKNKELISSICTDILE